MGGHVTAHFLCEILRPLGQLFEGDGFTAVGEGQPAGEQHGSGFLCPGAVFVVTHQGEAPAGKLHPDLMAAARMQPDGHKRMISCRQTPKFQPCRFYAGSLLFHHEDLVLPAVLKQKILPVTAFRRCTVNHGHILLDHLAILDDFGQPGGSGLIAGIDHDPPSAWKVRDEA